VGWEPRLGMNDILDSVVEFQTTRTSAAAPA
jgi:hypothetical protein